MLHPDQFEIDEAWVAFRLNDTPIDTEDDGAFDCLALMDAASCFILACELLPVERSTPVDEDVRRLLSNSRSRKQQFPRTLFVSRDLQVAETLAREAEREAIEVVRVPEIELVVFIGEAREGFRQHFGA